MINKLILGFSVFILLSHCSNKTQKSNLANQSDLTKSKPDTAAPMINNLDKLPQTNEEWKAKLTPEEYYVLREKGTEKSFSGEYEKKHETGIYVCKGCGTELFRSDAKFDSHCGWPSFYEGIDKSKIKETIDYSYGMKRTEVTCAKCGGHLGHVFNDGPADKTGLRYCINSVSLGFVAKEKLDTTQLKK